MAEEYQIEGNITEITHSVKSSTKEHSFTFVPGQNHTITVDGKNHAVFVPAFDTAKMTYLLAYDKKLTIEFDPDSQLDLKLGKSTLTFEEKNDGGIDVTIKSDSGAKEISDLQIVKCSVKL